MTNIIEPASQFGILNNLIIDEIVSLVAESNYTTLYYSNGRKITVSYHLAKVHSVISSQSRSFTRVNRSTVINLNHVSYYNYDYLKLGELTIIFSRRRKGIVQKEFLKFFNSKNHQTSIKMN